MKLELKRCERNLTITFINYTLDKLLKMYCCYFLFFLRLSLFSCTIPLCWLVYSAFVYIYSDQLKPGNSISFYMILALVFFIVVWVIK